MNLNHISRYVGVSTLRCEGQRFSDNFIGVDSNEICFLFVYEVTAWSV